MLVRLTQAELIPTGKHSTFAYERGRSANSPAVHLADGMHELFERWNALATVKLYSVVNGSNYSQRSIGSSSHHRYISLRSDPLGFHDIACIIWVRSFWHFS